MKPRSPYPSTRQRAARWADLPAWLAIAVALFGVPVHAALLEHGHGHAHAVVCGHDDVHAQQTRDYPGQSISNADTEARHTACALCDQLLTATATACADSGGLPIPVLFLAPQALPQNAPDDARPGALPARAPPRQRR